MSNLQSVSGHLQNEDSDIRRRRLLFWCWHRGTQESDVMLGRFAEAYLADFEARNSSGSKLCAIALTSMCSTGSSQRGVDASKGTRVAPRLPVQLRIPTNSF
ncbi:MAG TPA: succinate dehydrogenase assembly factor 2 [Bradyrhizobium sp.]|nr:succinate dehydrogenase assembly factor 2 [Bradyrhizobium sp.]